MVAAPGDLAVDSCSVTATPECSVTVRGIALAVGVGSSDDPARVWAGRQLDGFGNDKCIEDWIVRGLYGNCCVVFIAIMGGYWRLA